MYVKSHACERGNYANEELGFDVLNGDTFQQDKQPAHHAYTVKMQLLSPKRIKAFFLYKMEL